LKEFKFNLIELESFANELSINAKKGDIYLLSGELGVGKTTFVRFFINSLYNKYNVKVPKNIRSPSFPILINYPLLDFEIYHYDFYRLKNINELTELGVIENIKKNICIIEWPEIIKNNLNLFSYYSIDIKFLSIDKRKIQLQYFN
jgi:tRNA threonylcarbamoyladenosine biosynthesis protein TsaE